MKILIAIDGSPCSSAAVAEVAKRPWPAGSEFRVIFVEAPLDPKFAAGATAGAFDQLVKLQQGEALQHLQSAVAVLAQVGVQGTITSALLQGLPKDTIVAAAEEWGADLVILGSHGYGPLRRFFLGSVSSYVANNAPCSVEIVRPRHLDTTVSATSA